MADLILSPVIQVVYDRLASPLLQKLGNMWNLTDNLEKLQRTIVYVQSVLEDAEQHQLIHRDVRTWLAELKRVVYDAEDILDEITITYRNIGMPALGQKLDRLRIKYADKIRDMLDKLETTMDEGSKFNLREPSVFHTMILPQLEGVLNEFDTHMLFVILEVLDDSIGAILFLRYLNLSHTHIKSLPYSIEKLNYLETLNVRGCYNLKELPNLSRMNSLRHLNNSGCEALTAMLTLDETSVNAPESLLETESLKITQLENVPVKLYPGFKALKKMKGIESLGLYWRDDADHCCLNTNPEEEFAFTRFQERKQNHSFKRQKSLIQPDARRIDLIDCRWCDNLPTLGNHMFLNRLLLQGMHGVKRIGDEFYGESTSRPFPALRELSLIDFPNLEEWFGPDATDYDAKDLSCFTGSFPANNPLLTSLEIESCPLLWSLPTFGILIALKSLTIRWCEKLSYLPNGMQNLNALESLEIGDCHGLMLLLEIGTTGSSNL
ncbi:hypothetical protein FEM48_Zijuj09G0091200 [Ziziphus jujuba var. spinosa]|uniref:Disease resistance RPP13-like protein 1 n=1 Tax=Ziziphus jujuba var. spinosa TaxID=714518 RepID=A0A978US40_ZIZJJ|nr:hypothetical protein FEM48_Zijuj09G0091200 [Ziziphus jujuba var. spinosa]